MPAKCPALKGSKSGSDEGTPTPAFYVIIVVSVLAVCVCGIGLFVSRTRAWNRLRTGKAGDPSSFAVPLTGNMSSSSGPVYGGY